MALERITVHDLLEHTCRFAPDAPVKMELRIEDGNKVIRDLARKFKILVPRSVNVTVVPDPFSKDETSFWYRLRYARIFILISGPGALVQYYVRMVMQGYDY